MNTVSAEKFKHDHWGDCVRVSNGEIEFVVTVGMGPRIIRLAKVGGVNELMEDLKGEVYTKNKSYTEFWGGEKWMSMGGHRFWHSPENMPRTFVPHDLPISYAILPNGVSFSVDIEKIGVKNIMTATMNSNGEITITHKAKNIGFEALNFAPWCISVFEIGGLEVIPVSKMDTGFLSNRMLALWPYSDVKDSRLDMDNKYIYLTTSPEGDEDNLNGFKIGLNCVDGYVMYFNHNNLFVKKFDYIEGASYPDNGCNFESYTNCKIMELESLGALTDLKPGDTVEHTEVWNLFCDVKRPGSSEEIDKIVEKYIRQ